MSQWTPVGSLPPESLLEPRLELHHAAQLPGIGIARSLLPERDDDSHTALHWHATRQWVTDTIPGTDGLRAGLRPAELTLTLGRNGEDLHTLELAGKTRQQGLDWLRETLRGLGAKANSVRLDFHYDMPPHAVEDGAAFRGALAPGFQEFAAWFGNAALLVDEIAAEHADASPVLTWPHHFDLATLLNEGTTEGGEERSIGVGLSPGDGNYAEPYFYVTPSPVDEDAQRADLPWGHWRTEGFFGAILTASELLTSGRREHQEDHARRFLREAITAGRDLLKG